MAETLATLRSFPPINPKILLGAVPLLLSLYAALHPPTRTQIQELFLKEERTVISVAQINREHEVVKIKQGRHLIVEFYQRSDSKLISRFYLDQTRNAHVNVAGHITSLAVDDVDRNGTRDVLVPFMDKNLTAKMAVFQFNPLTEQYELAPIEPY